MTKKQKQRDTAETGRLKCFCLLRLILDKSQWLRLLMMETAYTIKAQVLKDLLGLDSLACFKLACGGGWGVLVVSRHRPIAPRVGAHMSIIDFDEFVFLVFSLG